jgi:hypothetical protein
MKFAPLIGFAMLIFGFPSAAFSDGDPPSIEPVPANLEHPLGIYANFGAALDKGAFSGAFGGRWDVSPAITLGLQAEYNPWFSVDALEFDLGVFNTYGSVIFHWLELKKVSLHTTLHLGVSVLLFDLVAAPEGSVGPYIGISAIGVTFRPRDRFRVVLEAGELAMPIPSIKGAPYYYRQYRLSVGFQYHP